MEVTFYIAKKKINSTKLPIDGTAFSRNVLLKASTSKLNPTFLLQSDGIPAFTNMKCDWGYYFVTDIRSVRDNLVEIDCRMDVLATNRPAIMDYVGFVTFATDGTDQLTDSRNPALCGHSEGSEMTQCPLFAHQYNTDAYVITIASPSGGNASGFTKSYALSPSDMSQLSYEMMQPSVLEQIKKFFTGNPMDSIISCMWMPITASSFGTRIEAVKIGEWTAGVAGYCVDSPLLTEEYEIPLFFGRDTDGNPIRLQPNYTYTAPYVTMGLYLPFVGYVDLDPDMMYGRQKIKCRVIVDAITGDIVWRVENSSNPALAYSVYSGKCGAMMPIAQSGMDVGGFMAGAITLIGQAEAASRAESEGLAKDGADSLAGAYQIVKSLAIHTQINGGISGRAGSGDYSRDIYLTVYRRYPAEEDVNLRKDVIGLPLYQTVKLGDLIGFVQTAGASVELQQPDTVIREVNSLLNGGVYLE